MNLKMIRKSDQAVILSNGVIADSFLLRLRGLIGRQRLNAGEGMLFPRNNSIHMWMMSISLDVLFLKRQGMEWVVLETRKNLKPWKLLPVGCMKADDTLELPAGTVDRMNLVKGEVLCTA